MVTTNCAAQVVSINSKTFLQNPVDETVQTNVSICFYDFLPPY
jgi:hypothetical protein